jgi:hypothetical protein
VGAPPLQFGHRIVLVEDILFLLLDIVHEPRRDLAINRKRGNAGLDTVVGKHSEQSGLFTNIILIQ